MVLIRDTTESEFAVAESDLLCANEECMKFIWAMQKKTIKNRRARIFRPPYNDNNPVNFDIQLH